MSDPFRTERIAGNEATFRAINETLEAGLQTLPREEHDLAGFVCECGDSECSELVHVDLEKYEQVRSDSRRFLIVPGHEILEAEDVVELGGRYAVVQKHEHLRGIVEVSDLRRHAG